MAKTKKRKIGAGDVASNRYASYRYELQERLECGIELQGTEVKALRESGAQLKDGYASLRDGELWLHSIHIPPYAPASRENHDPERPRRLLAHRHELDPGSPVGRRLVSGPAIAAVQNRQAQTEKILSATRVIKLTMALLAALLVFASILLISNTIRLSLFSRRREVEVMKLVGATDWFIRWPFVLEGLFLGALGGAAAIGLLALAKVTLVDPLASSVKLIAQPDMIAFPVLIVVLMGCAVAVSALGSGLSLRRFLRV